MEIRPALDKLVTDLKAAGLTGSHYDPALVDPPAAAWIQPRALRDITLGGGGTLLVWIYLLATPGENESYAQVFDRLDDALAVLDELHLAFDPDESDVVDLAGPPVLLPDRQTPLPAYRRAVELDIE
jgi:hypothetical protein